MIWHKVSLDKPNIKRYIKISTEEAMFQGKKLGMSIIFGAAFFVVFLFSSVGTISGQDNPIGNVTGFIYAQDGNTPLGGAVVKFKNVSTGKLYESGKSDSKGIG